MKRTQLKQKSTTSTNVVPGRLSRSAATHKALIVSGWVGSEGKEHGDNTLRAARSRSASHGRDMDEKRKCEAP